MRTARHVMTHRPVAATEWRLYRLSEPYEFQGISLDEVVVSATTVTFGPDIAPLKETMVFTLPPGGWPGLGVEVDCLRGRQDHAGALALIGYTEEEKA